MRFGVSDDKRELTCGEDILLRAISGGDRTYIKLNGLRLKSE